MGWMEFLVGYLYPPLPFLENLMPEGKYQFNPKDDTVAKQFRRAYNGDYERQMSKGESMCPHCFVEDVDVVHVRSCKGAKWLTYTKT